MANEFNLKQIFATYFGYTPEEFKVEEKDVKKSSPDNYYEKDSQGRDVFMPLTLGGLFLPYVWISVSSSKIIEETGVTERRGSVKEQISCEDWVFNVKGLHVGHDGSFPEKDVDDLRALYERNEAVVCKSALTDIYLLAKENEANDKVAIFDYNLHDNKGVEHVRAFEFMMKSDTIFELEITD